MAHNPVTLSAFWRLSAGALWAATVSIALASCAHKPIVSQYGFKVSASENQDVAQRIDDAWFEIANRATTSYSELAYVMLAVRMLELRVEFNAQGNSLTEDLIRVQQSSDCLANGALLPIMGALVQDFLQRDVGGAVLGAADAIFATCALE